MPFRSGIEPETPSVDMPLPERVIPVPAVPSTVSIPPVAWILPLGPTVRGPEMVPWPWMGLPMVKEPPPVLLIVPPAMVIISVPPMELVPLRLFRVTLGFRTKSAGPEPKLDTEAPDRLSSALTMKVLY